MRFAALLVVGLLSIGCCRSRAPAPTSDPAPRAADPTTPKAADPAPKPAVDASAPHFGKGRLEEHFAKHGAEMGIATKEDYLARAQALVRGGAGIDTLKQRDGDTCFFKESTGEFAVLSDKNLLRTYFRPNDGRKYFERQRDK